MMVPLALSNAKAKTSKGIHRRSRSKLSLAGWIVMLVVPLAVCALVVGFTLTTLTFETSTSNCINTTTLEETTTTSRGLPAADPRVKQLLEGLCQNDRDHDPTHDSGNNRNGRNPQPLRLSASILTHSNDCLVQIAKSSHRDESSSAPVRSLNCLPFAGGNNTFFGLPHWCAWPAEHDVQISADILKSDIPGMEQEPIEAFRSALLQHNVSKGIVIDAGAQVGLYTAAALSAGHYVVSIDIRHEHVQMNLVSRALNNKSDESNGIVVHGALSNQCGQWGTVPKLRKTDDNPGGTHIQGRVTDGWPFRSTLNDFDQADVVPVVTLDAIMDRVLQTLPAGIGRKVHALKIDIEGYEPWAFMGATRLFSTLHDLKPNVIVMELFVRHIPHCNATQFLTSLAQLGYLITVSPRLNVVQCTSNRNACKDMAFNSDKLNNFLQQLDANAEMDLLLVKTESKCIRV